MYENEAFSSLVAAGNPSGEVVALNRFVLEVKGLEGVPINALILFSDGQRGIVREIHPDRVTVLNLDKETMEIGTLAVLQHDVLSVPVGEGLIGRVVSVLGDPLDGKGPISLTEQRPVFASAPGISERALLDTRLEFGVAFVDMLFPIVLGQRIALLGDSKSGKSSVLTQMVISQKDTGRVVVICMMGKRKVEVDRLIATLEDTGAIKHTIVVVANMFSSLVQSYIAPYAACAMAEHFWYGNRDMIVVYDDLSSHAKVYREMSLIMRVNPGRDSYPGDMFYAHSSLLERAGRLASNGKTMATMPVVLTPSDDITAYLPTSIMSITDGQIIFDLESFRKGIRPAINAGLSVTRVGGVGQNKGQKALTQAIFKKLADYHQAEEFSHFGSELSADSQADLELGKRIYEAFKQTPGEVLSVIEQQLVLETIMKTGGRSKINVGLLKTHARELAPQAKGLDDLGPLVTQLLSISSVNMPAPGTSAGQAPAPAAVPADTGAAK
jgi:F-type H+/Na+-transporting ATPase subunit alpha